MDARRRERRQVIARRRRRVKRGAKSLVWIMVMASILAGAVDARAPVVTPTAASADVIRAASAHPLVPASVGAAGPRTCRPVASPTGYVNPLARAWVRGERIDMGVDYAGSGTLTALGAGRVTYVATEGTGWPGAFIEYWLLTGPDAGCSVFYAEGVAPIPGLRVGDTIRPGQAIATIIPHTETGIEIGWGAGKGTTTYAAKTHQWTAADDQANRPSGPGKSFSALIAALGGPRGRVEG